MKTKSILHQERKGNKLMNLHGVDEKDGKDASGNNMQTLKGMANQDELLRDMKDDLNISKGAVGKLIWSYLQYTSCQIDGKDSTIIEIKHVWSLINAIEDMLQEKQETINLNVKTNMSLIETIQRMVNERNPISKGYPLI